MIEGLRCPACGEVDMLAITVHTAEVCCTNSDCDTTFTPQELREQAKGLERLAKWCEACPAEDVK